MKQKQILEASLLVGIVIAGLWPVVLNLATSMNMYEFLFLEYLISTPTSLLLVLLSGKREGIIDILKNRKMLALIALIGVLNYSFMDFGTLYAEHFISASLVSIIFRSYPLLMLFFLPPILKERVSKYQIIALGIGFAGIYLAFTGGTLTSFGSVSFFGLVLMLMVALSAAFANSLTKRYVLDIRSALFLFNLISLAIFSVLFVASGAKFTPLSIPEAIAVVYTGALFGVAFCFLYYTALSALKTTIVLNLNFLAPFLTIIFASVFLGNAIPAYYILSALLVAAGIVIQRLDKLGGSYLAKRAKLTIFDVSGGFVNTGNLAISTALKNGGRVLAVKLDSRHRDKIAELANSGVHDNVFTDEHEDVANEADFIKEIMGVGKNELVVLKAGDADEGEKFFELLHSEISQVGAQEGRQ